MYMRVCTQTARSPQVCVGRTPARKKPAAPRPGGRRALSPLVIAHLLQLSLAHASFTIAKPMFFKVRVNAAAAQRWLHEAGVKKPCLALLVARLAEEYAPATAVPAPAAGTFAFPRLRASAGVSSAAYCSRLRQRAGLLLQVPAGVGGPSLPP